MSQTAVKDLHGAVFAEYNRVAIQVDIFESIVLQENQRIYSLPKEPKKLFFAIIDFLSQSFL